MSAEKATLLVIANTHARGGEAAGVLKKFEQFLKQNNTNYFIYHTKEADNALDIQKLISLYNSNTISVVGGDGTINLALNALPDLSIKLHIIPAGSGNDLAKMIYSSDDLDTVFKKVLNLAHETLKVDIWKCNDRRFSNGFGVGFDGELVHRMQNKKYMVSSSFKYWIELLKIIFNYNSKTIKVNGETIPSFMLSVANGQVYGGSFKVAPKAIVDDGLLDVVNIKKISKLLRYIHLPKVQKGTHLRLNVVDYNTSDELTISSDSKMLAHIDGEPLNESVYHIKYENQVGFLT
jgi:YegS/Rv2252/BmrU family lipid kinase